MYNLESFAFVGIKKYKKNEIVCLIENEDNRQLLEFIVDHDNILDYYEYLGVDTEGIKLYSISDDYEDICSNLFIDLKESENSESINGLHVRSIPKGKKPFWEFVIDNINSSFIPKKDTDTKEFLEAYKVKVKASSYKPVFL